MSEQREPRPPEETPPAEPAEPTTPPERSTVERKVGRTAGRAFGWIRKTKVWQESERAYHEGRAGLRDPKPEEPR